MQEGQSGSIVTPGAKESDTGWQFQAEESVAQGSPPAQTPAPKQSTSDSEVNWTASEFIEHNKSSGWYTALIFGTIGLAAIIYLLTNGDKVPILVVAIVAIGFGILGARKPRELQYSVGDKGIQIGDRFFPYGGLRSFSVVKEEGIESIWLMPLKRFKPIISIYFEPNDAPKIVDLLSKFLPVEHRQLDMVDKLMHRLRF